MKILVLLSMITASFVFADQHGHSHPKHTFSLGFGSSHDSDTEEFTNTVHNGQHYNFKYKFHIKPKWALGLSYDQSTWRTAGTDEKAPSYHQGLYIFSHHDLMSLGHKAGLYGEVGLGLSKMTEVEQGGSVVREDNNELSTKLALGVDYHLTKNFTIDLALNWFYRTRHEGDSNNVKDADLDKQFWIAPTLGVNFMFGGAEEVKKMVEEKVMPKVADADSDGVADEMDKCPGTASGVEVNKFGCKPEEKIEFNLDIKFATGKSKVNTNYTDDLARLGRLMQVHNDITVNIEGHTDNRGNPKYNKYLSQKRAEAVKTYLLENYGVDAKRISASGFGDAYPIADNKTGEGRTKNRRVVARINVVK